MNILIIIKNFGYGGAENHVCDLSNAFSELGHNVVIVSKGGIQQKKLSNKIKHYKIHLTDYKSFFILRKIRKIIRLHQINIIHGHQRLAIELAVKAGKKAKIPTLGTIHGRIKYDLRSNKIQKNITGVITVSNFTYNIAKNTNNIAHKSSLIFNGTSITPHYNSNNKENIAIYASRLDGKHINTINFIITEVWPYVVKSIPDAQLHIIGDGDKKNLIEEQKAAFNENTGKDSIQLIGYKSNIKIHLEKASLALAVGRVAIESLSVKTPVLSINFKHGGPIVSSKNYNQIHLTNFVENDAPPPSAEKLIKQLIEFFRNKSSYQKDIDNFHKAFINDFGMNQTTNKTLEFYQELIRKYK